MTITPEEIEALKAAYENATKGGESHYIDSGSLASLAYARMPALLAAAEENAKLSSALLDLLGAPTVADVVDALTSAHAKISNLRADLARVEAERDRLAEETCEAMRLAGYSEWAIDENMRRMYAQAAKARALLDAPADGKREVE